MPNLLQRSAYDFELPPELIAQQPLAERAKSRLLVIDRASGRLSDHLFCELPELLSSGDRLILNDTKVLPARLKGQRSGGGKAELLLLHPLPDGRWEALARPGKKLQAGSSFHLDTEHCIYIDATLPNGNRIVRAEEGQSLEALAERFGQMPLPHYIEREEAQKEDRERYQTVFAKEAGAVAAPTAGLHFTRELLSTLSDRGIAQSTVTLHVGLGTFRPVQVDNIQEHSMHSERYFVTEKTAKELNQHPKDQRLICVGTTSLRTLETAASESGHIEAGAGESELFVYPGYHFRKADCLITNFHQPGSTLIMLVSALAGYDLTMEAYKKAVKDRYRFFSYGDAMLIL
jgi:S-adenosylmethionine:tRNA ribosyltransferase-isomerase